MAYSGADRFVAEMSGYDVYDRYSNQAANVRTHVGFYLISDVSYEFCTHGARIVAKTRACNWKCLRGTILSIIVHHQLYRPRDLLFITTAAATKPKRESALIF